MGASAVGVGGQLRRLFPEMWRHRRSPHAASPRRSFLTQSFSFPDISSIYGGVKSMSSCKPGLAKQDASLGFVLFRYSKQAITSCLKQLRFSQSSLLQSEFLSDLFRFFITNVYLLALLRVRAKNSLLLGCSQQENFLLFFRFFNLKSIH